MLLWKVGIYRLKKGFSVILDSIALLAYCVTGIKLHYFEVSNDEIDKRLAFPQ